MIYLICGWDSIADYRVQFVACEHLVVDQRLLLPIKQDGHGVAFVHIVDNARAEVGIPASQHPVPDPIPQVNVKLAASCRCSLAQRWIRILS